MDPFAPVEPPMQGDPMSPTGGMADPMMGGGMMGPGMMEPPPPAPPMGGETPEEIEIPLPDDEKDLIAKDVERVLEDFKAIMRKRWKREDEIEDAYAMKAPRRATGDYPGASDLCSEMIMATVDQAKSRISDQILSVEPLIRVEPIDSALARQVLEDDFAKFATALERMLDRYSKGVLKIESVFPAIAHRFTKLGTAVVHADWAVDFEPYIAGVDPMTGMPQINPNPKGRVKWQLVNNRDVLIWPPWSIDWQDGYEWVGHQSRMSVQELKGFAREIGLDDETLNSLILHATKPSADDGFKASEAAGYEPEMVTDDELLGIVNLWQLWCRREVGGYPFPVRLKLYYSPDLKKVLKVYFNPNQNGRHPYFPIRYKQIDQSAWGNGPGHELFQAFLADTAYMNIGLDNLMAAAFSLTLVKAGSMAEPNMDRPYPGQRVATEDPAGDVAIQSFAEDGATEMTYRAMEMNERRKVNATGMPAVLQGQGDPTLKSGAGTGSTMALIEQAGKKFKDVDAGVRRDLSPLYCHTLDLIAQWGKQEPEVLIENAAPEDIQSLARIFQLPPGTSVEKFFKLHVEAPSAANNRELQKQNALVVWNFMLETGDRIMGLAQQVFPAMNPAGLIPYLVEWSKTMEDVAQEVIDLHDLPGMRDLIPEIPVQPDPRDQMLNTLMQQLQQLQAAYQELQAQLSGGGGPDGGLGASDSGSLPPGS